MALKNQTQASIQDFPTTYRTTVLKRVSNIKLQYHPLLYLNMLEGRPPMMVYRYSPGTIATYQTVIYIDQTSFNTDGYSILNALFYFG